jgi:hypothetical protein
MTLLNFALPRDDVGLFIRWFGSALLTGNAAQRILLLVGRAATGKSTIAHKAAEAAKSVHDKPRGHLIGEQEKEQPKQTEKFLGKPIASGKISATLAMLKTDLSSSYTH